MDPNFRKFTFYMALWRIAVSETTFSHLWVRGTPVVATRSWSKREGGKAPWTEGEIGKAAAEDNAAAEARDVSGTASGAVAAPGVASRALLRREG